MPRNMWGRISLQCDSGDHEICPIKAEGNGPRFVCACDCHDKKSRVLLYYFVEEGKAVPVPEGYPMELLIRNHPVTQEAIRDTWVEELRVLGLPENGYNIFGALLPDESKPTILH